MGVELGHLVDLVRRTKGPFFLARLALRVRFPLERAETLDDALVDQLVDACRALGFDPREVTSSGRRAP